MTLPSMAEEVSKIIQSRETEWNKCLQDSEQRVSELEKENEKLHRRLAKGGSILDEIADVTLKDRLRPLFTLEPLPLDTVIREASVVFEDRLRAAGDLDATYYGEKLIRAAFRPEGGPLEFSTHRTEQEGVLMLYLGAMKFIRNPPMHKLIEYPEGTARIFIRLIDSLLQLLSEREPQRAGKPPQKPKARHIGRTTFLNRCTSQAATFFEKMLDEAERRGMILYWGTAGFSVRIPLHPPLSVMYGYPRATFQVYTAEWLPDPESRSEFHGHLREIAPFRLGGQYTNSLQVNEETELQAYAALAFMWDEIDKIMASASQDE